MLGCRRTEGVFMNLMVEAWLPLDGGCRLGVPNRQSQSRAVRHKRFEKKWQKRRINL